MFELIESNFTRNRYETIGFQLTDFQKATLIWNKPNVTHQERIQSLIELAKSTKDINLKKQIVERIEYEEKAMKQFEVSSYGETVYVVLESNEDCVCGYFGKYETSLAYAKNYAKKEEIQCTIEKHKIINEDNIPLVKTSLRMNPNLCIEVQKNLVEYSGAPIASLFLDRKGNISNLWSNELADIENEKVNKFRNDRFEYKFLSLPYVHDVGLPVRYIPTGEYGIIGTTEKEWDYFLNQVNNGMYVDFSDVAITVFFLTDKGYWTHQHCNPIYLEVEIPKINFEDKKNHALYRALDAMSEYFSGHKDERQERLVLATTREYADVCKNQTIVEKSVNNAKHIDDILW